MSILPRAVARELGASDLWQMGQMPSEILTLAPFVAAFYWEVTWLFRVPQEGWVHDD